MLTKSWESTRLEPSCVMAWALGRLDASFCDDVAHLRQKCCESGGVGVPWVVAGRWLGEVDSGDDLGDVVSIGGSERWNIQGTGHDSLDGLC